MYKEQEFKKMLGNSKINEFNLRISELIRSECLQTARVSTIKSKGNIQNGRERHIHFKER